MCAAKTKIPATPVQADEAPTVDRLVVNAQYLKDLSFENPNMLAFLSGDQTPPALNVNIEVRANGVGDQTFEVELVMTAQAMVEDKPLLVTEITYAGIFTTPDLPQDQLKALLLIDCPQLLFPFARSVIASVTHESGFPPMLLEPVDFAALFASQQAAA